MPGIAKVAKRDSVWRLPPDRMRAKPDTQPPSSADIDSAKERILSEGGIVLPLLGSWNSTEGIFYLAGSAAPVEAFRLAQQQGLVADTIPVKIHEQPVAGSASIYTPQASGFSRSPVERGRQIRELLEGGSAWAEILPVVGVGLQTARKDLLLARHPRVAEFVQNDQITATAAVKLIKAHKEAAAVLIESKLQEGKRLRLRDFDEPASQRRRTPQKVCLFQSPTSRAWKAFLEGELPDDESVALGIGQSRGEAVGNLLIRRRLVLLVNYPGPAGIPQDR